MHCGCVSCVRKVVYSIDEDLFVESLFLDSLATHFVM